MTDRSSVVAAQAGTPDRFIGVAMTPRDGAPVDADKRQEQNQQDALRQAITEGARTIHRAVEFVSVQDAKRRIWEPELFAIGRGIEVLSKSAWMLNHRLIEGGFKSPKHFGHRIVEVLQAISEQAGELNLPAIPSNPVLPMIVDVAQNFIEGGRFKALEAMADGASVAPYLWWNEVQIATSRFADSDEMDQVQRYLFLRTQHTRALQELEQCLAVHLKSAQEAIWGAIRCSAWIRDRVNRSHRGSIEEPWPLDMQNWNCQCDALERQLVWTWEPVDSDTDTSCTTNASPG